MKNELLLSAAILPHVWYGRRSDCGISGKGSAERKATSEHSSVFWLTTWDGRILRCLSGLNERITTTLTTRRTWNAWRHKGRCSHKAYACSISPHPGRLFTGMNAARHRVTSWTLRKKYNA